MRTNNKLMNVLCFDSILSHLNPQHIPHIKNIPTEWKTSKFPLFVTWEKDPEKKLRGCIGTFSADENLHDTIVKYAKLSAFNDSRFTPITFEEVPFLNCKLSLLTNFESAKDIYDWEIGKHGISISVDGATATFLPEVALDNGYTKTQTLEQLLKKAGITKPFGAHKKYFEKNTQVTRYQSSVFEMSFDEYMSINTSTQPIPQIIRRAVKAGSWYPKDKETIESNIAKWQKTSTLRFPGKTTRALIGPHAGLQYSGQTLTLTYHDSLDITRCFVIGPRHSGHLHGVALSVADKCECPVRDLDVDIKCRDELRKSGIFTEIAIEEEEIEHSLELHFPFIAHFFPNAKIVPILVGDVDDDLKSVADVLRPYLKNTNTFFVVSSDFCHWGDNFGFTYTFPGLSISESIAKLDYLGLSAIQSKNVKVWRKYLEEYKNTICGKNAITLLLKIVEGDENIGNLSFAPTHHAQSGVVRDHTDSVVSYFGIVLNDSHNNNKKKNN